MLKIIVLSSRLWSRGLEGFRRDLIHTNLYVKDSDCLCMNEICCAYDIHVLEALSLPDDS